MQTVIGPHVRDPTQPLEGLKVCWDAENIWECKIPREISGLDKRLEFKDLPSVKEAEIVLWKGTYWFRRLCTPDRDGQKFGRNGLAMLRLLAGLQSFSGPERIDQLVKMKIHKGSVNKLRSMLAVVDGLLMQIVLSFPGTGILDWKTVDRLTHSLVSTMLPDQFRDKGDDRLTTFEKVKKIRNGIKEQGFNPVGRFESVEVPQELSFFRYIIGKLEKKDSPYMAYQVMTLSQTRASGVPPRSVYSKTLNKIRDILQETPSPETYSLFRPFIRPSMDLMYAEVLSSLGGNENRDRFFESCVKAAKISLSDSAEFFSKSEDGGKLEAARLILKDLERVDKIDLVTGIKSGYLVRSDSNQGEMLFMWACNMFHDRNKCYERNLMSVRISLVAELGKYRAITVSHLAHAVLLHVLSHVFLEFLRVIPSSESGVKAANHAWNFFKRLSHKNPSGNFIFDNEGFMFSTDFEQATDFVDHDVGRSLLANLCRLFGIPKWYAETCTFALCAPRQVEYLDPEGKTLEMFLTKRGMLMGDPVTKVILHVYHLVCRVAAKQLVTRLRQVPGVLSSDHS